MSTTTISISKAPAASKATLHAPAVRKFTVTERWVEITAKIPAEHAAFFEKFEDPGQCIDNVFDSYATSVHIYVDAYRRDGRKSQAWFDIRLDAGRSHARGQKLTEIRFRVKERKWQRFIQDCETLKDYTPAEVIRGAIAARVTSAGMVGHRNLAAETMREGGRS